MLRTDHPPERQAAITALRAAVGRLERGNTAPDAGVVPLCTAIDSTLPGGGLARAAVHEVLTGSPGAAAAFSALILARSAGAAVWIGADPDIWPAGASDFGLSPAKLVLVEAKRRKDMFWAFEEALRSPGVAGAALFLDAQAPDLVAARRLQLAAEAGGGIGLLILPDADCCPPSAARSRWRIEAAPGTQHREPCWRLTLLRASGGRSGTWVVAWDRNRQELMPVACADHAVGQPRQPRP